MLRSGASRITFVVWLPEPLANAIQDEAEHFFPLETGGMIAGYESDGVLVVTDLIDGGPNARRERSSFLPDGRFQQRRLEEIYAASGRTSTYIGDWHSHPRGVARPSRRDRRTAARIARADEARCRRPLTLIAGDPDLSGWNLWAFRYFGWRGFREMKIHLSSG